MTQEDKELLLKDLCARFPYGVKIKVRSNDIRTVRAVDMVDGIVHFVESDSISPFGVHIEHPMTYRQVVKPYLRPMSSMTEEEKRELQSFYPGSFGGQWLDTEKGTIDIFECSSTITLYLYDSQRIVDWLNKKMFDYRGLIEMGLALKASKDMYK